MPNFSIPTVCQTYLSELQPGDKITRMLGGSIPMQLIVDKIEDNIIYAKGGWKFNQQTGCEIDEDLGWDGVTNTGSILVYPKE